MVIVVAVRDIDRDVRELIHDEKGKAIDLINDALSKNVITEAEYQEYYSTIK